MKNLWHLLILLIGILIGTTYLIIAHFLCILIWNNPPSYNISDVVMIPLISWYFFQKILDLLITKYSFLK
jgi:hypothetical protein